MLKVVGGCNKFASSLLFAGSIIYIPDSINFCMSIVNIIMQGWGRKYKYLFNRKWVDISELNYINSITINLWSFIVNHNEVYFASFSYLHIHEWPSFFILFFFSYMYMSYPAAV